MNRQLTTYKMLQAVQTNPTTAIVLDLFLALLYQHVSQLLQMIFQLCQDGCFLLDNHLFGRTCCPDRSCRCFDDRINGPISLLSIRARYQDFCYLGSLCFANSLRRGIVAEQTKHGFCEDARSMLQLRKGDRKNSLGVALDGRHLVDQAFPLPCQVSHICIIRGQHILGEGIFLYQKKLCDNLRILFICLGLSQCSFMKLDMSRGLIMITVNPLDVRNE